MPAVTQVKVLSPERTNVARDQGFHFLEVSINICARGECIIDVPGLSPQRVNERSISEHAKREPQLQFTSLAHLLNRDFLKDCYNSLNRNKAVGIDGVCWKEYGENLDDNVEGLITRMKHKSYKPIPARRVYIPKNEKEKRPLGIPALENKIVEMGITRIVRSIYEEDFLECSYGFRPKRSCHQAITRVDKLIMTKPVNILWKRI